MSEWLQKIDVQGRTTLERALHTGHGALADILIQQDAMDDGACSGRPPLHRAACLGLTEAVASLLRFGASPLARDRDGETPLHHAVRNGHLEVSVVLAEKSEVNAPNTLGMTPLHWACLLGNEQLVALLVANRADPFVRSEGLDGLTPLEIDTLMGYHNIKKTAQYASLDRH